MTTTEIETTPSTTADVEPSAPVTKVTYAEAMDDLTGHEELAITGRFGEPVDDLPLSMQLRALIFTRWVRDGREKKDAFKDVMALRVREFADYFVPSEADPDAEGNGEQSE